MDYDCPDFTEDTEAHKRLSNLPRSCGWEVGKSEFKARQSSVRVCQLNFYYILLCYMKAYSLRFIHCYLFMKKLSCH